MSEEPVKKSNSILSRTVKNIKRNRKARNFIRVERKKLEQKVKVLRQGKDEVERTGTIYLSHIPPGFYEDQLRDYFGQFGEVTNVRLERSVKTGRSKGYAFIEFQHVEVAKIAAETMNNYILFDRILKAKFEPRIFYGNFWKKPFNTTNNPKYYRTRKNAADVNKICTPGREKRRLRNRLYRLDDMIQRLQAKGINYSYKPAIRKEIPDSPCTDGKYVRLNDTDTPVLEIDESDKEIEFMTPPNVVKKKLSVSKDSKSPLKKPNTKKQGKIKKRRRRKLVTADSADVLQEIKDTPGKKELSPNAVVKKVNPDIKKENIKIRNQLFSQKLKSLSQGKGSKKSQRKGSKKQKLKQGKA